MRGSTRWLLGLVLVAIPALFFVPGIGFDTARPAALARRAAAPDVWYYRVQTGDVLSRIAERELGTFKRYKEILALNPDVKPRNLVPHTVLRMPAKVPLAVATESTTQASQPDSRALVLSIAALLGALLLVLLAAGKLDRKGYES